MQIIVKHEAIKDNNFQDFNYTLDCVIEPSKDADATEVVYSFVKAMEVAGFYKNNVIQAFYDVAMSEAYEWDYEIEEYNG